MSAPGPGGPNDPPGHSFLSAVGEIRNMENALLSLLTSFHSGDLSAFGSSLYYFILQLLKLGVIRSFCLLQEEDIH